MNVGKRSRVRHVLEECRWGSGARARFGKESRKEACVKSCMRKRWLIGFVKFGMNLLKGEEY